MSDRAIKRKLAKRQKLRPESCEFPNVQGFSRRNLYYIKKFYEFFTAFSDREQIVPPTGAQVESEIMPRGGARNYPPIILQLGGQLPWSHIKILLDKVSEHQEALFYIQETIEK